MTLNFREIFNNFRKIIHQMTLTSTFHDDVSPWLGYQDGKNSDGLSWFIFYLHHTVWREGLCSALQAVCYVKHGADILLSIVVAFDTLVFLSPRVCSGSECDRLKPRAPSVSIGSTVQRFRLAQRPLGSIRSISCVFSNPIICSRAFL